MSNEFVMVPRAELVRLQENMDPHRGAVAWGIVCDLLAKPSEQRQGEPVWYMTEGGLSVMHAKAKTMSDQQGLDTSAYSVPLYTHADTGDASKWRNEAHRFNLEVERLTRKCQNADLALKAQTQNCDTLHAQLAERDALLRDKSGDLIRMAAHLISAPLFALQDLQDEDKKMTRARVDAAVDSADARLKDAAYELRRIADALSASAEPSDDHSVEAGKMAGWIPVDERKPERNKLVLAAFDTHVGRNYTTAKLCQDGRAHFDCETWYVEVSGGQQLRTVTHWREFDCSALELSTPTSGDMIELCHKYWSERRKAGEQGAVKWIQDIETGALMIFTRGEYREQLMELVYSFGRFQVPGVEKP